MEELKEKWEENLRKATSLNAPKGEIEMILWFLKDIKSCINKNTQIKQTSHCSEYGC